VQGPIIEETNANVRNGNVARTEEVAGCGDV
jgi:hypothetical protein